jgi:hypothetical protein
VDVSGDLYYSTGGRGTIERLRRDAATPDVLVTGLEIANALAVDEDGNVFFSDTRRVYLLPPEGTEPIKLSGSMAKCSYRVAVAHEGNVYYADLGGIIWKVPASRVLALGGAEARTLPWPLEVLPPQALFALAAVPAILGVWIAYGRRNHRWYRVFKLRHTPTIPSFLDGGQQTTRSAGLLVRQEDSPSG